MTLPWKLLRSTHDESVNFIAALANGNKASKSRITEASKGRTTEASKEGMIEARYVRRAPEKVSAYLSSHSGCNQGCKFCWLTNTGQTSFDHVPIDIYAEQLDTVLRHARFVDSQYPLGTIKPRVNVNFMARGEPLANRYLMRDYRELHKTLQAVTEKNGYSDMKINISTIMPGTTLGVNLAETFGGLPTYLYYSLYSVNREFRKKWIPNGIHPVNALTSLKEFQVASGMPIAIHFALIKGENDSLEDVQRLVDTVAQFEFTDLKFNVVRFNPHPSSEYTESPNTKKIFEILDSISSGTTSYSGSRIVPRVGYDVNASCGMFHSPDV